MEFLIPQTIANIHDMVFFDLTLKVRKIMGAIGISHGSLLSIFYVLLDMGKLSARRLPCLLKIDNKHGNIRKECFARFQKPGVLRENRCRKPSWVFRPTQLTRKFFEKPTINQQHLPTRSKNKQRCAVVTVKFNQFCHELLSHPP